MSTYLERLYDEYRRAAQAGKSIMDTAAGESRDLSSEESEQVDRAFADVERLKGEIDKIQNFEKLRAAGDAFREVAVPIIERATGVVANDRVLFRALFNGTASTAEFTPAFANSRHEAPELTLRALQSAGGSAVETSFADFVTVYERTISPMLRPDVVTILNRADGSPLVLPRVTADPAPGGTITAEAGGITELDPTVSSIQLNPYKYGLTNLWSRELAEDNTIGLEDIIARTTGRALGLNIGSALTLADGSSKPQGFAADGLISGTFTASGTANNTFFGPADVIETFYLPAAPYRQVGVWQASTKGLAKIRKLQDSTGQLIWEPSLALGEPEKILGKAVYENPHLGTVGSALLPVYFGDFSRYVVAKTPTRVETSIHYKFNTDQLALRTVERVDGDLPDVAAIVALKCANA